MKAHTMTVSFDEEVVSLDEIVGALNKAGYTVPEHRKITKDH